MLFGYLRRAMPLPKRKEDLTDKQRDKLTRFMALKFRDNREAMEQGKPLPFPELGLPPVEGMDVPTVPPSPSMPPASVKSLIAEILSRPGAKKLTFEEVFEEVERRRGEDRYPEEKLPLGPMTCVVSAKYLLTN